MSLVRHLEQKKAAASSAVSKDPLVKKIKAAEASGSKKMFQTELPKAVVKETVGAVENLKVKKTAMPSQTISSQVNITGSSSEATELDLDGVKISFDLDKTMEALNQTAVQRGPISTEEIKIGLQRSITSAEKLRQKIGEEEKVAEVKKKKLKAGSPLEIGKPKKKEVRKPLAKTVAVKLASARFPPQVLAVAPLQVVNEVACPTLVIPKSSGGLSSEL